MKNNFYSVGSEASIFLKEVKLNLEYLKQSEYIRNLWPDLVGDLFANNTKFDRFSNGVIFIQAKNFTWVSEIRFFKDDIIKKYNLKLSSDLVKDIKVFSKKYYEKYNKGLKFKEANPNKRIYINKDPLSAEEISDIKRTTRNIENEKMRSLLNKFMEKSRRIELSMDEQGYIRCKKCESFLHKDDKVCQMCKADLI